VIGFLNLSLENISQDDIHLKPSQGSCQTQAPENEPTHRRKRSNKIL